jgi:hypothetical protein
MNRVAANLPARLSSSSEEITMEPDGLQTFIDDVGLVVSSTDDDYEITKRVAERLSDLMACRPSSTTWGVVGIYSGVEREVRYLKPVASTAGAALTPAGEEPWEPGQVSVCCTTDNDVHAVAAVGNEPTVGIHVYGGNIGTIRRPSYDPATGEARWFVSGWDQPRGFDRSTIAA